MFCFIWRLGTFAYLDTVFYSKFLKLVLHLLDSALKRRFLKIVKMESCGRSLVHFGTYKRFPSRTFQPNEHVMRDMILNLMAIVGFIFFGLILVHLFFEIASKYSLYAYIAIFVGLECSVISVRFYLYLKEKIGRQESYNDAEDFISEVVKISVQKRESKANPLLSSYDSKFLPDKNIENQKRNSF